MAFTQFPSVSVGGTGGLSVGTDYNVAISQTYQYAAGLTMLRGSHTIKTGFDCRVYH